MAFNIGHRGAHAFPTRDKRGIGGLVEEFIARAHDTLRENLDRLHLLVAVIRKSIDRGIVLVTVDQVEGSSIIGGFDGADLRAGENLSIGRELAEERL